MSTFKVGGVSKLNGQFKVRYANDMTRVKVLAKGGHDEITLLELPSEMTKLGVVKYLQTTDLAQNAEIKFCLDEAEEKYSNMVRAGNRDKPKKEAKKPKKTPVKIENADPAVVLASIRSRVPEPQPE